MTGKSDKVVTDVTARDDFAGRSKVRFGVGEFIDLVAIPRKTAPDLGALRWFIESGGGKLSRTAGSDGTGLYTAGDTAGEVTLVVKVVSGPQAGATVATEKITVVAPTDAVIVQAPNTTIQHDHGRWSVGFLGIKFLRPTDVSFVNTTEHEGTCTAVATGYLAEWNGKPHKVGPVVPVGRGNAATGSRVMTTDTVWSGSKGPPYSEGDFLWAIPWWYGVRGSHPGGVAVFATGNQHATADASGRATIQKKGFPKEPFSRMPDDAESGFHGR
jgi:hypothetical protein